MTKKPRLPTDSTARKKIKLSQVDEYFPDALVAVAEIIAAGQEQHGTAGWDRTKSTDHEDCIRRHTIDRGTLDTDGKRHTAKRAWRALAALQIELEQDLGLPPPRGVSVPAAHPTCADEVDCAICDDRAAMSIVPPEELDPNDPVLQASWRRHVQEHMEAATQLELPFTGKQLTCEEAAKLPYGTKLRVVVEDNPTNAAWCPRCGDSIWVDLPEFDDKRVFGAKLGSGRVTTLGNRGWRFERA
jgi:hypothetical protein